MRDVQRVDALGFGETGDVDVMIVVGVDVQADLLKCAALLAKDEVVLGGEAAERRIHAERADFQIDELVWIRIWEWLEYDSI